MRQGGSDRGRGLDIAIIGVAGRFPGIRNVDELWRNLRDGVESIHLFSDAELAALGVSPELISNPRYVKAAALLEGFEYFDAALFGISPAEAEIMDPQHRVFLECVWEALETAGYDAEQYSGLIGLFAGARLNGYIANVYAAARGATDLQILLSNDKDHLTTRVSYKLGLEGPSVAVQSACSTSLVAVHLACQSLLSGESDLALAGGVAVKVPQRAGYLHTSGEIFSPDGHTRTFDSQGQGTLFGSGVGIVVLKRLAEALEDGDHVRAVIRGSAVNNDGAQRLGYAAPRPDGQAKVIAAALEVSGVEPATITYVEAHGTATPLGDPIEIAALRQAFAGARPGSCAIGSVKTNVGHLETAAGVVGLIKTVLALEHRQIPPSLHFERPNPAIDFAASPFYVNTRLAEWKTDGVPRRAGVSSFGMGGTNAHLVLEEAPAATVVAGPSRPWQLLLLSARTATALERMTTNLAEHLERNPDLDLADVAYTLHLGRRALSHRRILVSSDVGDAAAALHRLDPKRVASGIEESRDRPVSFLFPGQGAQHVGMARTLYAHETVFRREVDRCAGFLEPHLGLDLRTLLAPPAERRAAAEEQLAHTAVVQPVLFTVEFALARLWISWGVRPESLLGHSIGEYVAACLAGTFQLEDALALVALRGRLMQELPPGAMLSVPLGEREVGELLGSDLSLAAVNAPSLSVVSGPQESIDRLHDRLRTEGLDCRRLRTSHAFHSAMMEPMLEELAAAVARLPLSPPRIPFLSNLTGDWITAADATDPLYWVRHLRQTVRFSDGLARLLAEPDRVLLEVGPGRSLSSLARRQPQWPAGGLALASLPDPDEPQSDLAFLLGALGRLWLAGLRIDGKGFYAGQRRRRVLLPAYPFERQRYWIDGRPVVATAQPAPSGRTADLADWFFLPVWKQSLPPVPPPRSGTGQSSRWLVFGDRQGLGAAIADRLRQEGHRVITASMGEGFQRLTDDSCTLAPGCREDYDALLREYGVPDGILHLWSVTGDGAVEEPADLRARSFYSLLFLAQALGERDVQQLLRLRIVTNGLWAIGADEIPCAEKATLLGPVRGIPQEYPHISCRAIDVALPRPDVPLEPVATRLLAELAVDPPDMSVAYRGAQRWLRTFEAVRLEERTDLTGRLCSGGVYLITGGLGGIGLTLAERLARDVRARLALISRTGLPAREEWSAWLREWGEGDATSRKIRRLEAIERMGGEVLVLSADAADEAQMRTAVRQARERFGRIHGAIHAAGVPGGGLIQLKTPAAVEAVLAPKVRGARILAALLEEEEPLDFLVLLSSAISLTGGVGQVDYCAANAFLDAFSQERNARGHFTLAINWDVWRDLGMAVAAAAAPARRAGARPEQIGAGAAPAHPLLGRRVGGGEDEDVYLTELSPAGHWLLAEHRIWGEPVLPGAVFVEIAWAALRQRATGAMAWIRDLVLLEPLHVPEDGLRQVQTVLRRTEEGFSLSVRSRPAPGDDGTGAWREHAACVLGVLEDGSADVDLEDLLAGRPPVGEASGGIALPTAGPVSWGPHWQEIRVSYLGDGLAHLELQDAGTLDGAGLALYPPLLDLATACGPLLLDDGPYLPFGYQRLRLVKRLPARVFVRFRQRDSAPVQGDMVELDLTLLDEAGRELVTIEALALRRLSRAALRGVESAGRSRSVPPGDAAADLLAEGIAPEEGAEAFSRALAQLAVPQIVISARPASIVLDHLARGTAPAPPATPREGLPLPAHQRPALPTPYVAPRNEIERAVTELWQQALGFATIGVHDDFFDLGGDSILSLRLLIRLRETFELELPLNTLFERPTVAELAELVLQSFSDGLGTEDLSQTLAELEWLSDEEVRTLMETDREERLDV
jgi:phthiocerol/phenolphthiocerol synthesis type-I polyketide synthase E